MNGVILHWSMDTSKVKKIIMDMAESNGYSYRDSPMQGDDFRIFLTPPGGSTETVEVFKEKSSGAVCCGAGLIMGGEQREKFFSLESAERENFKDQIEILESVKSLDFFQAEDNGENFVVTMRCEFSPAGDLESKFEDCMNRINLAGYSVEEEWEKFFDKM